MVCIWRHGGHVGSITQGNMLLIPLSDSAGVGGWYCPPYPERLIAKQELRGYVFINIRVTGHKNRFQKKLTVENMNIWIWASQLSSLLRHWSFRFNHIIKHVLNTRTNVVSIDSPVKSISFQVVKEPMYLRILNTICFLL